MPVPLPRLLVVTDASACARRGRGVVVTIARALADLSVDGALAVVARQPGASEPQAAALCQALTPLCRAAGALIFGHTYPALVGPLGLDGCHLPERASRRAARLRQPRGALLGASLHPGAAVGDVIDYLTWSPIFAPLSKADARAPLGIDALHAVAASGVPVFALGGVTAETAGACLDAGAAGVAVSGAVCAAADPAHALRALLVAVGAAPRSRRRRRAREAP